MSRATPFAFVFTLLGALLLSKPASAHCDTTNGPVVTAARAALDAGDPALVLHWVSAKDEPAVRAAFDDTMKVRALGGDAKTLADRHFFETLVRIHRAGEGAPYTGISDGDPEPIIKATDHALETGSTEVLERELVEAVKTGLAERFAKARAAQSFKPGDIANGRAFVATYVPLTHWVEGVYAAAQTAGDAHAGHGAPAASHEGHGASGATVHAHGSHTSHLPWLVAAVLAIAALVEATFLLRRRTAAAAA